MTPPCADAAALPTPKLRADSPQQTRGAPAAIIRLVRAGKPTPTCRAGLSVYAGRMPRLPQPAGWPPSPGGQTAPRVHLPGTGPPGRGGGGPGGDARSGGVRRKCPCGRPRGRRGRRGEALGNLQADAECETAAPRHTPGYFPSRARAPLPILITSPVSALILIRQLMEMHCATNC